MEVRESNQIQPTVSKTEARHAEEKLRLVFEAAPSAMIMVDDRGLMTLINTQTERLLRNQRKELLEQPIEMLVPERYRPGFRSPGRFLATRKHRPMGVQFEQFLEATKQLEWIGWGPPLET